MALSAETIITVPQLQLRTHFSPQAYVLDKKNGVWFPDDDAEYLLKLRVDLVPNLYSVAKSQNTLLLQYQGQLESSAKMLNLEQQKSRELGTAYQNSQKSLESCLGNRAFYQEPWFYLSVGFVGGMLLTGWLLKR